MRMFRKGLFLAAMIMAVTAPAAFGQQATAGGRGEEIMLAENNPGPGERGELSEEKREEIRTKIETVRIWRLTDALKLDPDASAKLAAFIAPFNQQRREIQHEQMETMRTLRHALKDPKPDEKKIKAALETLEKNQNAMQDLRKRELSGLKNILTIEQQARYVVFQQEFQREMRSMIAGARGKEKGEAGQGGKPRMRRGQAPPEGTGQQPEN